MTDAQQAALDKLEQKLAEERGLPLPPYTEIKGNIFIQHGEVEIIVAPDGKITIPQLGVIDDALPRDVQESLREIKTEYKAHKPKN